MEMKSAPPAVLLTQEVNPIMLIGAKDLHQSPVYNTSPSSDDWGCGEKTWYIIGEQQHIKQFLHCALRRSQQPLKVDSHMYLRGPEKCFARGYSLSFTLQIQLSCRGMSKLGLAAAERASPRPSKWLEHYKCWATLCSIIDEVLKLIQWQHCVPQLIKEAKKLHSELQLFHPGNCGQ